MSELFQPFVAAFEGLGDRLRDGVGGWEVRFENPPGAYLHLSKPKWGDQQMDGVHLEAYVSMAEQEGHGEAVVALHCEKGCPGGDRESLITALAQRVRSARGDFPRDASPVLVRGEKDCTTVVEVRFAFCVHDTSDVKSVVDRVEKDLRQLQRAVTPHVDAVIDDLLRT
jgi:hypothetical protein